MIFCVLNFLYSCGEKMIQDIKERKAIFGIVLAISSMMQTMLRDNDTNDAKERSYFQCFQSNSLHW